MEIPIGYCNATFLFGLNGVLKPITWSMAFQLPTPETTALEAATAIQAEYALAGGAYIAGQMMPDWQFTGVSVSAGAVGGASVAEMISPVTGTNAGGLNGPPVNCAVLMTKHTLLGGRRGRGRAYLPACNVAESEISTAGRITGNYVTILGNAQQSCLLDLEGAGYIPMLLHSESLVNPGPVPPPTRVTGISIASVLATQRRRMR